MSIIVWGIIACEVGFWVVMLLGLAARYLLRLQRLSTALLLSVPVIDVLLLTLIAWDLLANRAVADFAHGLGAVYLGFTVAFGHQLISTVDAHFAHRFGGGPAPTKRPKTGPAHVRYEWQQWLRALLAGAIASLVLGAIILLVGDPARTAELANWYPRIGLVLVIWLITGPLWDLVADVFRSREPSEQLSS
ncbi:hypothetical protein JOF28_001554 [Leucobacter exalbidus]|uniref:Membrane protein YmcC n=1 Tax=Leucobacter exalbidus TaxID=662960 RepID=A0A940PT31_9MICO|nr:hypothetical protein [Leucobacter exalbidus]MBP1326322.1 hypothetical protein [Leucobacter exalbidus]